MRALVAGALALQLLAVHAELPAGYEASDWGVAACNGGSGAGCCCSTKRRGDGTEACTDIELVLCFAKELPRKETPERILSKIDSRKAGPLQASSSPSTSPETSAPTPTDPLEAVKADGAQLWILTCGFIVFFMQCGFAMLEIGSVRRRSTQNIIFKNIMDASIAAIGFFSLGYGFAYGRDSGFTIGENNFFLIKFNVDESEQHLWFFQYAFAATAATIVSGCVAERCTIQAYMIYSLVLTCIVYPVVVHWVWGTGRFSAFANRRPEPFARTFMIDYAGSGVVHACGGFAGLVGTIFMGPRVGRFSETGETLAMPGQDPKLASLGVLILWFGWYGFNCGSTLAFDGENAGKVATTTTLSAAMACITTICIARIFQGAWAVEEGLNGILAGLVSITAPCSVVDEYSAILIGLVGGFVYYGAAQLLLKLKIDDPLNAWPVHGACGVWGCIAVSIFAQQRNIRRAYGDAMVDASWANSSPLNDGKQFVVQLAGITCIIGWTVAWSIAIFGPLKLVGWLRISEEEEQKGLDATEHGGTALSFMALQAAKVDPEEPTGPSPEEKTGAMTSEQPAETSNEPAK